MVDGKSILAIIPARGGSQGIPRKNIVQVGGKPLIAWTIEEAKKSKYIDRLILSSDDAEIIDVARSSGCDVPFVRPAELARDDTPGIEPVLHATTMVPGYEIIVLLQPTSPLRNVEDIDGCIAHFARSKTNSCVSITQAGQSPYWMYTIDDHGLMRPLMQAGETFARRQDLPKVYMLNGAVYVANCAWMQTHRTLMSEETLGYVMPQERSLDIDTEQDLQLLEMHFKR